MPSSDAECPSFFSSRLSAPERDEVSRAISSSRLASFASLATATASDKSPTCFHTSAAASCGWPASTKNAEANKYLCLESSAYAFFNAASRFFRSEKSREKKSASRASRAARNTPASVAARPSAAKRSAHGFSPPGSREEANAWRAAASISFRSVSSSRTHSGAPVVRSARHARESGPSADPDPSADEKPNDASNASCASLCVAHASSSPRGPCASRRTAAEPSEPSISRERLRASLRARARLSARKRRPASSTAASAPPSASRSASSVANNPTRSAPVSPGRLRAAPRDATSDAASSASEAENRADASFSSAFLRLPTRETAEMASSTAESGSSRLSSESRFKSMPNPKRAGAGAPPNPANPPNAPASNSGTRLGTGAGSIFFFACAVPSPFDPKAGGVASPETTTTRSSRSCATDAARAKKTEDGPPSSDEFELAFSPTRRRAQTRLAAARARRVSPRTSQSMSTRGWYSGSAVAASATRNASEAPAAGASVTSSWSTPTTSASPRALHANPPTCTSPPREGEGPARGSASPPVSRHRERFAAARTRHASRRATRTSTRAPRAMASASAPPPRSNQLRWHFLSKKSEPTRNSAASANAPRASLSASQTSTRPSGSASATAAPVGDDASVVGVSVLRSFPSSEDVFGRRRHPASVQRRTRAVESSAVESSVSASAERRHAASATSPRASTRAAAKARARVLVCPAGTTAGTVPGKHEATREKASPSTRGTRGPSFCFATSAHESTSPSRRVAASAAAGAPFVFVFAAAPETSRSETSYASSEAIV